MENCPGIICFEGQIGTLIFGSMGDLKYQWTSL